MDGIVLSTYSFSPTTPHRDQKSLRNDGNSAPNNTDTVSKNDSVELSPSAMRLIARADTKKTDTTKAIDDSSEAEKEKIEELKKRDAEVKAHEAAHKSNGGSYAGEVVMAYTVGPDGKQYAKSGYVNFNMAPESTPSQTIAKANAIYRAAMAPTDPSSADLAVAQQAKEMRDRALEQEKSQQS